MQYGIKLASQLIVLISEYFIRYCNQLTSFFMNWFISNNVMRF